MPLVRSLKFVSEYIYNRKIILLSGILSEYETRSWCTRTEQRILSPLQFSSSEMVILTWEGIVTLFVSVLLLIWRAIFAAGKKKQKVFPS